MNAHLHLLLNATEVQAQLMAECPYCGAMTIESVDSAWAKRFIACECGSSVEVAAESLRCLRALAAQYQRKIDELLGAN